jgi:hypothetical protein
MGEASCGSSNGNHDGCGCGSENRGWGRGRSGEVTVLACPVGAVMPVTAIGVVSQALNSQLS